MNKITICIYSDENGVNSAQSKTVVLYKTEEEAKNIYSTLLPLYEKNLIYGYIANKNCDDTNSEEDFFFNTIS